MEKFKELVADLLEYDEVSELDMNTPMKDLDDWDSLTLLGFLAMIENEGYKFFNSLLESVL